MNNHVHLIRRCKTSFVLPNVFRALKKFTSRKIEEAIRKNTFESRKEWMPWMFERAGNETVTTKIFNFVNRIILPLNCRGMRR